MDWSGLVVGPCMTVFGESIVYTPAGGSPITITAVFTDGYMPVMAGFEPAEITSRPVLGVQVSQMPLGWTADEAQGDTFVARGRTYIVKAGKADSFGGARLEANLQ
jgi:predicted NAD/FAD-dependent oxidoreductase